MSWLLESWSVTSEKNGRIDCKRVLGQWNVVVQGCNESSSYMNGLWKDAVSKLPKTFKAKRILMLGLAAGSSIEMLHRRFPGCHIVAVEWDPAMLDIMKRLRLFRPAHAPEILVGDAAEIVPKLQRAFDLILFDLYQGPVTPASSKNKTFFELLRPRLDHDGYLLVNAYAQSDVVPAASSQFSLQTTWMHYLNRVAIYRHVGAGTVGDPLPDGYSPFRGNYDFWKRELVGKRNEFLVGSEQAPGVRRWNGPVCIEKYHGEIEPVFNGSGPKRLIIWQPAVRLDKPDGWRRSRLQMNAQVTGFVDLKESPDPYVLWMSQARRHLKQWQLQSDQWDVVEPSVEDFLADYLMSPMEDRLKQIHHRIVAHKAKTHGDRLKLFALRRKGEQTLEAGLATLDIPELNQSIHIASYIHTSAKHDPVGVGLIYLWFEDARQRGIRFLDFDLFRGPGDPPSWKGFTRFKSQFGTRFIKYPKPLLRWEGTWRELWNALDK